MNWACFLSVCICTTSFLFIYSCRSIDVPNFLPFDLFPYSLPDILIASSVLFLFVYCQCLQFLFFWYFWDQGLNNFASSIIASSSLNTSRFSILVLSFPPMAIFIYIWLKKYKRTRWWTTMELDDKHSNLAKKWLQIYLKRRPYIVGILMEYMSYNYKYNLIYLPALVDVE